MKKRKIVSVISALTFVCLFCFSYVWVSNVLRHKVKEVDAISTFYKQPKDTADVLLVGSSHAFLSMSPMELWLQEGISSLNLGTPAQPLSCSYYLIKEGIERQHPKVIVLEAYGCAYENVLSDIERIHMVTDCMPLNKNKIEMFRELLEPNLTKDEIVELWFPLFRYHSRWNTLKSEDFFLDKAYLRGYKASYQYCGVLTAPEKEAEPYDLSEPAKEYFARIVELCKEENISLIVSRVPMAGHKKYAFRAGRMKTLLNMAEEMGVPVLDFELLTEEIGLDYSTDFLDHQHMNSLGAKKISDYLASYLKKHAQLEDHRGEKKYSVWEEDAVIYQQIKKEGMESLEEVEDAPAGA